MTLLYYYGPIFRVVFAVIDEGKPDKPDKKRKKKKVFEVVYETEATAKQIHSEEWLEEARQKAKRKAKNKKIAMFLIMEDL